MKWFRSNTLVLIVFLLSGCAGTPLIEGNSEPTPVAELSSQTPPIPLRIAVYLANPTLVAHAVHKRDETFVVTYGEVAPHLAEHIYETYPKAFDAVFSLADFPTAELPDQRIDVVLVIESVAASQYRLSLAQPPKIDTLIKIGIYTTDGTLIDRYSVANTSAFSSTYNGMDLNDHARFAKRMVMESLRNPVIQSVHLFPREKVIAYLKQAGNQPSKTLAQNKNNPDFWKQRKDFINQAIESGKYKQPTPTITIERQFGQLATMTNVVMSLSAVQTQMNARQIASNPALANSRAMAIATRQQALMTMLHGAGEKSEGGFSLLELIGGRNVDKLKLLNTVVDTVKSGTNQ